VPVLEQVTFGVFAELQRGISAALSAVRQTWDGYVDLRNLRRENEELARRLEAAQVELQEQRAIADRSQSLERLLELRGRANLVTTGAAIIAAGSTPEFRTLTIDKGTSDGVMADMAVIAPQGVVGRIVTATGRAAKVQLLVDRNAAAGALVERSRAQGVAVGSGGDRLTLEYVPETADLVVGDVLVTSGLDGIYPKGYVIGRVESFERGGGSYTRVSVIPAVDFLSIEEVLVVLAPVPANDAAEEIIE
jgi:rod shape-determining protein MreC